MASSLSNLPYISFLTAYPHPAFILHSKKQYGQSAPSLNPLFGNSAFRALFFGPDVDTNELGCEFMKALGTVERAQRFGEWLERARVDSNLRCNTLIIELKLPWAAVDSSPVQLELSQTHMDDYVICTSTPRSPLPRYSSSSSSGAKISHRRRDVELKLQDFPLPPAQVNPSVASMTPSAFHTLMRTPTSNSGQSSRSPERSSDGFWRVPSEEMKTVVENFEWHSTPLGPRSEWADDLKTAVNYVLAHPYPLCLWWGPELVLIYNDAYKDMAGSKHPQIFAERGSVSWGELWEIIGPLAKRVFEGEAIAKRDDLLFFNRLTEAKLPEETYHSWSWVPVIKDDGSVAGIINSTFETTSKVITERWMLCLRDLANNAGLAKTQTEFASAVMNVLNAFTLDCPFAAFYFASVKEAPYPPENGLRTSYIRRSVDDPPIKIRLRRAGAVGVPDPHPSVPPTIDLSLDPLTLRPSPKSIASSVSPVPSIHSQDPSSEIKSPIAAHEDKTRHFILEGREGHSKAPSRMSTRSTASSSSTSATAARKAMIWPFDQAFSTRRPVFVPNLPNSVIDGFDIRGWGEHAREAIVIPITADDAEIPTAILIMGLNSRRPFDDDYAAWIDLFRLSLNSLLTAVKGREADVIRANHLAELDSAKTAFFSNASHELRTPLTLIQGPLQDSLSKVTDLKVKENLKMASRNVTRLSRLVDSLMDFSKIAANRLEGHFRAVQLGECTAGLASLFRSVIEKSRIEYIVDCDVTTQKVCYIDPELWEKIVFNLIGNAFKYTMSGSIRIVLEYDNDNAFFHVKDTGVGIPQADIVKVFDRFHRVDAISRNHEGTGIGLALTKELVKLHGGSLSVTSISEQVSPTDHGSCFTVALPIGKDHLPAAHIVHDDADLPQHLLYARGMIDEAAHWTPRLPDDQTPSDTSDSSGSNEGTKMDPTTLFFVKSDVILLVDDNSDMRRYIKSLFIPYCQVVEANNGQEALNLLDHIKPHLILSDVMMPVLDGYGLITAIRRRSDTRLIPIILVTAKESEESRVEGLLSGADDYLSKPFTGKELIARVHLQMQLGKRHTELENKFFERTREIQLLSDLSPVGIMRADKDGRLLYVNNCWYEISGHERRADTDTWRESVREEDQRLLKDLWDAAFDAHNSKGSHMEFRFKNGKYAKGSFQPLISDAGDLNGVIGTITDVSDQRLYEAARLAHVQESETVARKRAEEAEERRIEADERRRGQELLIDVTSHELRQPVSAILNCSSLVRSNLASLRKDLWKAYDEDKCFKATESLFVGIDEDLDALDAIYQCGLAQERIANDVLSLSRIQLQILSIHPVEFELVSELQRIVGIFRNELKMKRIKLELKFGKSLEELGISRVLSDKSRFGQVITNLLSNGIKFTDTSSTNRSIYVTMDVSYWAPPPDGPCIPPVGPRGGTVKKAKGQGNSSQRIFIYVAVRDSGPGLKPDDLTLLFQRFQQGSNSHNVFGGSGLGLFVSRKLCELMGGRIDVDSVYGEGATFRFFVEAAIANPLMTVQSPQDTAGNSRSNTQLTRQGLSNSLREHSNNRPLHVLITEDNMINQTILSRQLKKAGCTTQIASNGFQAIEQIKTLAESRQPGGLSAFDVILMDCEMPVMDGLTAVREIRRLEAEGKLPFRNRIFALTGNAREGQVQSALEAGMDAVLIKPYKLDDLLVRIQQDITKDSTKES